MSESTRQAWLDAWKNLEGARQSFGGAAAHPEKLLALGDMLGLAEAFKVAVNAYATNIEMSERIAARVDLKDIRRRIERLEDATRSTPTGGVATKGEP